MIERLKKLQEDKKQFADSSSKLFQACSSDKSLRTEIELLSQHFLHRSPNGCNNCYMDAYIELINLNIEKIMNTEIKFKLLAGALLRDVVNQDMNKNMTIHNTTDELALYHLKTNPEYAELFEELPEDWKEQAENFDIEAGKPAEKTEKKAIKGRKPAEKTEKKDFENLEETDQNSETGTENSEKTAEIA